jgi:hypothetical protein
VQRFCDCAAPHLHEAVMYATGYAHKLLPQLLVHKVPLLLK